MANFDATILVENSEINEVVNALEREFYINFKEAKIAVAFGMTIQIWETPEEFLNYDYKDLPADDSDKRELFFKNFDASTFNISVDIFRTSVTTHRYIEKIAETLASGISFQIKKRTILTIDNNIVNFFPLLFENGERKV